MKIVIKQIAQWGMALCIGFLVINLVCYAYEMPARGKPSPNGASPFVSQPNTISVHGREGYSIGKSDKNGFMNPDKELADDYILMLGASHTVGAEVGFEKRYSVIVDNYFNDDEYLHTYNLANSAHFLPGQIKYFNAALEAFPNPKAVTIEIFSTDYSPEEIVSSMDQIKYDPNDSVLIFKNGSKFFTIKTWGRYFLPLIEMIINQKNAFINMKTPTSTFEFDPDEYSVAINNALALIRSEYDGPLAFVYHPKTNLNKNGEVTIEYSKTWDLFYEACVNNDIDVIDSGDDFLNNYEKNHELPYGFFNTSLGKGHINEVGHKIIADEIIDYLGRLE